MTGFARERTFISAFNHSKTDHEKDQQLIQLPSKSGWRGHHLRSDTENGAKKLRPGYRRRRGRSIGVYHGGMEGDQRRYMQEQFMSGAFAGSIWPQKRDDFAFADAERNISTGREISVKLRKSVCFDHRHPVCIVAHHAIPLQSSSK